MKAVIQRVKHTSVTVDGRLISEIPFGLAVYIGIGRGDSFNHADLMAKKISKLRIFEDVNGKMNLSVSDVGGEIMLISQFTLYGDCSHGNRPSFIQAEEPALALKIYKYLESKLCQVGLKVKLGEFGADMKIQQFNDGPVTIIYEI